MKFRDYLLLTKKRFCSNKFESIYSCFIVMLTFLFSQTIMTIVFGFFGAANKENIFFNIYFSFKNNRIDAVCITLLICMVTLSAIVVGGHFFKATIARKSEFNNKLMIGASHTNLIIETLIENVVLLFGGAIVGTLLAYVITLIIGLILHITFVFSAYIVYVLLLVELATVIIGSVFPVIWHRENVK